MSTRRSRFATFQPGRRRVLLAGLASAGLFAACTLPLPTRQGGAVKRPLVALLAGVAAPTPRVDAVKDGMRALGYIEGQTVEYVARYADGKEDRLPDLAAELVALSPNILVTINSAAIRPAKSATTSIPIVMVADNADPVAVGYISSLARPGANVTGLTGLTPAITQKRLQLLTEAVPGLSHVGMLRNPASQDRELLWSENEAAAATLGLALHALDVRTPDDLETAFGVAIRERLGGIVVVRDPLITNSRERIAKLAAQHKIPAMYASPEFVEVGGLMTYGSNVLDMYRRTATYIDKILRGARPADLPVEQADHFDLIVNVKAAGDLGLTLPQPLLARATEIVER